MTLRSSCAGHAVERPSAAATPCDLLRSLDQPWPNPSWALHLAKPHPRCSDYPPAMGDPLKAFVAAVNHLGEMLTEEQRVC